MADITAGNGVNVGPGAIRPNEWLRNTAIRWNRRYEQKHEWNRPKPGLSIAAGRRTGHNQKREANARTRFNETPSLQRSNPQTLCGFVKYRRRGHPSANSATHSETHSKVAQSAR